MKETIKGEIGMNKKRNIAKENKGITLVALVVTIVVLLILAGVSLNLVLGQNGIVQRAQEARKQTEKDRANTIVALNSLTDELDDVAVGPVEVEGVIIPKGYYYVGGIKAKGIVISDAKEDKEKYADKNQYAGGNIPQTDLLGNQWVWVPVETPSSLYVTVDAGVALSGSTGVKTTKYTKSEIISGKIRGLPGSSNHREPDLVPYYDNDERVKIAGFNSLANMAETITNEYEEMIKSIEKYKGFYIGRYELSENGEKTGKTQTDKNWYELYKNCTTLAANSKVKTRMIWGLQWDATCSWLESAGYNTTNSSTWGNYSDNTEIGHGSKKNTGFNESWKANNIYDFAGNCWEWTQEANGNYYRSSRGSDYIYMSVVISNAGSCKSNFGNTINKGAGYLGVRPTLYLIH